MFEIRIAQPYETDTIEWVMALDALRKFIKNLPKYITLDDIRVATVTEYDVYEIMAGVYK
jgi:hypothetical protein